MTGPVIAALCAAAEGQRPADPVSDWLRIALGAQHNDYGTLCGPSWNATATRIRARRLLTVALAACAEVGTPMPGGMASALEMLADAPLTSEVGYLLIALGLAELDEDDIVAVSDAAKERWWAALEALEGA